MSTPTTTWLTFVECSQVLLWSLILLLLAVCSLSPPLFFVRLLSCVAFMWANSFNADISKWNTGAVTDMTYSEYTHHAVVTFVECSSVCFVHSLFFFLLCVLFLHLCFFVRLLSCVAFAWTNAFNADITHWNVGAVTDMSNSKSSKKSILCLIFPNVQKHQCTFF